MSLAWKVVESNCQESPSTCLPTTNMLSPSWAAAWLWGLRGTAPRGRQCFPTAKCPCEDSLLPALEAGHSSLQLPPGRDL